MIGEHDIARYATGWMRPAPVHRRKTERRLRWMKSASCCSCTHGRSHVLHDSRWCSPVAVRSVRIRLAPWRRSRRNWRNCVATIPSRGSTSRLVVGTSGGAINSLPIAMGISSTEEGRQAFRETWRATRSARDRATFAADSRQHGAVVRAAADGAGVFFVRRLVPRARTARPERSPSSITVLAASRS